jgi:2-dehydropantoate 2-reductase
MQIRKVTLIGLGAMGSFFAPKLDAYLGRGNFRVLAGGERRKKIESQGITVNGVSHRFAVIPPETEGDPADLVIMAVKYYDLDQAIRDIKNQVGPGTQILCVLNGVGNEERVAAAYGWEHVLYSFMRVSIVMEDGVTDYDPESGLVHFGEAKNEEPSERVLHIEELFEACGIKYTIDPDMIRGIWFKFMCNVGENMTSALLGVPFGAYHVSDHANAIRRRAMQEVILIANRLGIDLSQEDADRQEKALLKLPFVNKPSTQADLEKGRATEVDMFAGEVLRLGQELGIETPVNWMYYHGIKVLEEKNAGRFSRKPEERL